MEREPFMMATKDSSSASRLDAAPSRDAMMPNRGWKNWRCRCQDGSSNGRQAAETNNGCANTPYRERVMGCNKLKSWKQQSKDEKLT